MSHLGRDSIQISVIAVNNKPGRSVPTVIHGDFKQADSESPPLMPGQHLKFGHSSAVR